MDELSLTKRSASHGSLRSNYSAYAQQTHKLYPVRRPLRSVNENVNFLRSPGPLESMLKTTTETGNIGVYSIRTTPDLVPSTGHSRLTQSGVRVPHDGTCHDDRRRLPSYMDTTSETISMCASDNYLSSGHGPISPSYNDHGARSYSMTTGRSRRLPSHKYSTAFQSHSSANALQRPRSPFPYPTRLKRPGVRPSSPALTDQGTVDYSRMVGIDHVSHRTVHGSYKPIYPQGHRRPPPVSMRHDQRPHAIFPQSSTAPYVPSSLGHGGGRGRSASQWSYKNPVRLPSHECARSSSLTSIVEMHQRPLSAQALRPQASFYYDYSESFDHCNHPVFPIRSPAPPFAPVPRRVSSLNKALVLRDESQARLDAVIDISVKDFSEASTRDGNCPGSGSPSYCPTPVVNPEQTEYDRPETADNRIKVSPKSTDNSVETELNSPENSNAVEALAQDQAMRDGPSQLVSDLENIEFPPERISESTTQRKTERDDAESVNSIISHISSKPPSRDPRATMGGSKRCSSHATFTDLLRSSFHHSLDPGLLDLAGFVSSMEKMARSPFCKKGGDAHSLRASSCGDKDEIMLGVSKRRSARPSFCAYRKNKTPMRPSPTQLASHGAGPGASQNPATPERQHLEANADEHTNLGLDHRQSATDPSSTGESTPASDRFIHSFSPFLLSDLSTPRTASRLPTTPSTPLTLSAATSQTRQRARPPTLSTKALPDTPEATPSSANTDIRGTHRSPRSFAASMPHRRCTSTPVSDSGSQDGSVRRYPGVTLPKKVHQRGGLQANLFQPLQPVDRYERHNLVAPRRAATMTKPHVQTSQNRIPLAHPVHDHRLSLSTEGERSGLESVVSDAERHHRGLRKQISHLRLRITQSKLHLRERSQREEARAMGRTKHEVGNGDVVGLQPQEASDAIKATTSTEMGNRLKRWVDHARKTVKAYARK